jgi:hypothetical protein
MQVCNQNYAELELDCNESIEFELDNKTTEVKVELQQSKKSSPDRQFQNNFQITDNKK